MKIQQALILLSGLLFFTANATADKAIFAGGCFWCMESDFEKLDGVTDVISGFTGGTLKNPTYKGDHSGHYEAVEITYDPLKVSYEKLLEHFWINIDPFDAEGQFCDRGHSYLSAIFVANKKERKLAEQSRERVVAQFPDKKVITPILDASTFYPVEGEESYHQDYYKKNPVLYNYYRYSCGRDQRLKEIWGDKAKPSTDMNIISFNLYEISSTIISTNRDSK
jgi:peptide-methionine (S)-S-oxide reductase